MKLYHYPKAPNPRRVRWVMAEKAIEDIEIVAVDLLGGENRSTEYRGRVGLPHVPALELDDGTVISESLAICRYLEARYPEPNLFGQGAEETAVIEMWTRRAEHYVGNPLMIYTRLAHPVLQQMDATREPEVADYNRRTAERMLKTMDRRLADSEWLGADRFTIADIAAVSGMDFARMMKWRPDESLTHVNRWYEACRARPAAQASLA